MRGVLLLGLTGLAVVSCGGETGLSEEAAIKKVKANLTEQQKKIVAGGKGVAVMVAQYQGRKAKDPVFMGKLIELAASGNVAYAPEVAKPDTSGWRVERKGDTVIVQYFARAVNIPAKKTYEVAWSWRITGGGKWVKFGGKVPEVRVIEE